MNEVPQPKRKISEMILELGGAFLDRSSTIAERQYRLTGVCTAWNLACQSRQVRRKQLEEFRKSYLQSDPETDEIELDLMINDLKKLIDRKLKMFPEDKRHIVSGKLVPYNGRYRIEIASANT